MNWQTLVASATGDSTPNVGALSLNDSEHGEYSDDDDYTDDDYESVEMAAWGDNAKQEPASWSTLIDSSIKIRAGGIGSGDLHRRGGNFKPLSEAAILAQRLNKPIPGKKSLSKTSGAARRRKKKATVGTSAATITAKPSSANKPYKPAPIYKLPERRPAPNAPPSTWGSKPLVETPFWEVQNSSIPPPSTPEPSTRTVNPHSLSFNPTQNTTTNNSKSISIYPNTSNNPVPATSKPVKGAPDSIGVNTSFDYPTSNTTTNTTITTTVNSTSSAFNPDAPGFIPSPKSKGVAHSKWNTEAPAFNPSPAPTLSAKSSTSNLTASPSLPAKTPVKMSSPSPTNTLSRPLSSTAKVNPLLSKQLDSIQKSVSSREKEKPYVTITLEIAEGISAVITLYQDSDPEKVAEEFGAKHNLIVSDTTKKNLARTFTHLMNAKKNKEQSRQA